MCCSTGSQSGMVLILAYAGVQSHGFLDYMIIVFARVLTFTLWHFRCFRFMCLFVVSGFASFIGFPPKAAKQGTLWEAASNTIPLGIVFFWGGAPCGLSCNTTRTRIHCQSSQFGSQTLGRMSAPFLATPLAWCGRTARLGLCDSSKLLYSMVRRKKRWLSRRRCCICRCIIVVAGWVVAKKKIN